ncbi:MAG TPA: GNAT family N-acetyltransferase [Gemmataceae bacterium]
MGTPPCRCLPWDSEFFGCRIARADDPRPDADTLRRALSWCRAEGIDCLYWLADADEECARLAEHFGFREVDRRVTLARRGTPPGEGDEPVAGGIIRPCRPEDVPDLRQIAAASHTDSRFFADGRFDPRRCGEMYAVWVANSCAGAADAVWVADVAGRAVGYCTLHRRDGGIGEIGLFAVAESHRGKGLGKALLVRGLRQFAEWGVGEVRVVTQGRNRAARHLYERVGFAERLRQVWYHRWFTLPPAGAAGQTRGAA